MLSQNFNKILNSYRAYNSLNLGSTDILSMKQIIKTILLFCILTSATSADAQLLTNIIYKDGNQKLSGFLGVPRLTTKMKAGVVILPAWMGVDIPSQITAERLAAQGYYSFVADIYGEGNNPQDTKKAQELSSYYKSHVKEYRKRIDLAIAALIETGADPNNIVVIGYCFGGTGALEAARGNLKVKGVVSFHGGLARDITQPIEKISAKVLVCHGAIDTYVPEQQAAAFREEMNKAEADWEMVYYANAVHAFTDMGAGNDIKKGIAYNEKAAKRSWALMLQFLAEAFGEI